MSSDFLNELAAVIQQRKQADPEKSYTASLYDRGLDQILKKLGEEITETIIASKSGENDSIIHEIADLWFHSLILLSYHNLSPDRVIDELERRFGKSGISEKADRKRQPPRKQVI